MPDKLVKLLAERYTQGAFGYANYWSPVIRPMGERLLDLLPLTDAQFVLDVGTGAGALLPVIKSRSPAATIVGIDHSAGMLRQAQTRPGVLLSRMDSRQMSFPAARFDVVILSFLLFHFPDIAAGLKELKRVLSCGGTIGSVTFANRPSFPAAEIWDQELDALAPSANQTAVDLSAVDQVTLTDTSEKVRQLMEEAGFTSVQAWVESFKHQWGIESFIAVRTGFGSHGARFRNLEPDVQEALLQRVREQFKQMSADDFLFKPEVVLATAQRQSI